MAVEKDKEVKVSVPMAPELHARLKALATKDGRMLGRFIAKTMEQHASRAEKVSS